MSGRVLMFYQDGNSAIYDVSYGPRIRLFYPDGLAEWASLARECVNVYHFSDSPCYLSYDYGITHFAENQLQALLLADFFDLALGFPPQEFLGYL